MVMSMVMSMVISMEIVSLQNILVNIGKRIDKSRKNDCRKSIFATLIFNGITIIMNDSVIVFLVIINIISQRNKRKTSIFRPPASAGKNAAPTQGQTWARGSLSAIRHLSKASSKSRAKDFRRPYHGFESLADCPITSFLKS